ncbi:MAG: glycosyltransferase [Acidimicrobiales bacterium]
MPVPLDRRVWQECNALIAAGYNVSVICPKGAEDPSRQQINGVSIYKYRPAPPTEGVLSFAFEFLYCWLRTAWLSLVVWRQRPFRVIQACNPPDTYWLLAALWRSRGVRFVYDQHDLNPELFVSRFGPPKGRSATVQYQGLQWLERMTYRLADEVISPNESYKRIALHRGSRTESNVTVVRSGPDTTRMRPIYPPAEVRRGAKHLLVYLGVMGPQDGVHVIVEAMHDLVYSRGRTDVRAALLGYGDCLERLRLQAKRLGLEDYVEFTGRVGPGEIASYLSAADIGLSPDLKTPLNDVSTMNKTMEYMCYCLPSVCFDLAETRLSAGATALYVPSGDLTGYVDAIERLLDDDQLRVRMGVLGRERVVRALDWQPQARAYVGVYDRLLGRADVSPLKPVPLDDSARLADFVLRRPSAPDLHVPPIEPAAVARPAAVPVMGGGGPRTLASIVIPAHNEERVIERLLHGLLADSRPGEFDIVVVCNGCEDRTAELARLASPEVRVIETPEASKSAALRLGDDAALGFPRLFIDADVQISGQSVRQLANALTSGALDAGGPRRVISRDGVGFLVRCYYDVWERLPRVQDGLFGRGVIALSERGNQRVAALPQMMADDLVVSEAFGPSERTIVDSAQVVVFPPRTLRDLHRRRVRTATGNAQVKLAGLQSSRNTSTRSALRTVATDPRLLVRSPVYLAVAAAARFSARRPIKAGDYSTWLRDESSRDTAIATTPPAAVRPLRRLALAYQAIATSSLYK